MSWATSFGAAKYHLQVSTTSGFTTFVVNDSSLTGTSKSVAALVTGTVYYWRVRATNSAGTSAYSPVWSFTTVVAAPAAPVPASPADRATGVSTSPTLSWNASTGANSYQLQVSTNSGFSPLVFDQSGITNTWQQVPGLANITLYYWRVNATNAGGTSSYSSAWSFTTIVGAPTAPALSSPAYGATGVSTNPTLSWSASSGVTSYQLQVSTSSTFSTTIFDQSNITSTSYGISGLANNTLYYWRVNAANAGGTSSYSSSWSFTTVGGNQPIVATGAATNVTTTSATLNGSINPNATSSTAYFEWGISSTLATFSPTASQSVGSGTTAVAVTANLTGLSPSTTYYFRVVGQNGAGTQKGSIVSFTANGNVGDAYEPDATYQQAKTITTDGVKQYHTIDPAGDNDWMKFNATSGTEYTIETFAGQDGTGVDTYLYLYDTNGTSQITSDDDGGAGTLSLIVWTANVSGTYYLRVHAYSSGASGPYGISATAAVVETQVTTNAASSVGSTSATLNGSVNPNGASRTAYFEWGVSSTLATFSSTASQSVGSGTSAVAVTTNLTGLSPSTTYYYRVVGQNSVGTQRGSIVSFTTIAASPSAPTLSSPANGATGVSTSPTLSWNSSSGATSYQLQMSNSLSFSPLIVDQSGITATSYTVSSLAHNSLYYWRVNASNVGGTSSYSSAWSFTTTQLRINISGTVTYGPETTPVSNATVTLTPQGGTAMTMMTSTTGAYSFTGNPSGTYTLAVTKTGGHPTMYTNAADALRAALYPTNSSAIGTALALAAADVNNDATVNAADALQIMLRYVGTLTSFAHGDWIFEPAKATINAGTTDIMGKVQAIAVGDVNFDAAPSSGTYFAKADGATQFVVQTTGATLRVNSVDVFEVPVRVKDAASIGSMSMVFQYPTESARFIGVLGPEGMVSGANNGVVAVAWFNAENTLNLKENDALVALRFKPTSNVKDFSLTLDPNSQITDAKGTVLTGISLEIPAIDGSIPTVFVLGQNYPNPFNPSTTIEYDLPVAGHVTFVVYNMLGQVVDRLVDDQQNAGAYKIRWDAPKLSSGVYMYHITVDAGKQTFKQVRHLIFLK